MNLQETILELCKTPGPSGFEEPVSAVIRRLLESCTDECYTDVMGNTIGVRRCGKENAKKLLVDAHVDEIGFIVTGVQDGFLRFAGLGGADPRMLPASCVTVLTDPPLHGVIATMPPHVLKKEETDKLTKVEDMVIDIGYSQEVSEKLVPVGTPAVYDFISHSFGTNGLCCKAQDDRVGFAAILRALDLLKDEKLDVDLYVMASSQEEVGTRGAGCGVFAVDPEYCIVIDVGHAKTPDAKPDHKQVIDGGVMISRGPNMNRRFTDAAIKAAKANDIKYQMEVIPVGSSGTNARVIQISREGVATALFGIPQKYMHSPSEVVSLDDIECVARLVAETAKSMKEVI